MKTIILNIAGLSPYLLEKANAKNIKELQAKGTYREMDPGFPAMTCSVQATLVTGKPPADHGIMGNGYFNKQTKEPEFWRQEADLVKGPCLWDWLKEKNPNAKTAVLFWQNSKFINSDIILTPAPFHTDNGMIEWCYSKPRNLYEDLINSIGEFKISDYWGPKAGFNGSRWITDAAKKVIKWYDPDLTLVYIPHLDYVSQKEHPHSEKVIAELEQVDKLIGEFRALNHRLIIVSEYGLIPVNRAIPINRILREKGYLKIMTIQGKEYIDYELSDAFALVDHQVAYVYTNKEINLDIPGIAKILDKKEQKRYELPCHADFLLCAEPDAWFSYYFWKDDNKKPFFAHDIDIHNKPGYDPCEMFCENKKIPIAPHLIKGSHGLPAKKSSQYAVFISSDNSIEDYAPEEFKATHLFPMLNRMI